VQAGLGLALADDAGVVGPIVIVVQAGEEFLRLRVADAIASAESVGQRQQENHQRLLMVRLRPEHVQADALRLRRFIEQAITRRFLQRRGNGLRGEGLEFKHSSIRG